MFKANAEQIGNPKSKVECCLWRLNSYNQLFMGWGPAHSSFPHSYYVQRGYKTECSMQCDVSYQSSFVFRSGASGQPVQALSKSLKRVPHCSDPAMLPLMVTTCHLNVPKMQGLCFYKMYRTHSMDLWNLYISYLYIAGALRFGRWPPWLEAELHFHSKEEPPGTSKGHQVGKCCIKLS